MKWASWITVAAGVGLLIAPFATGYHALSSVAMTEAVSVGLVLAALGLWTALSSAAPAYIHYVLVLFGVWSVVAPFVLGYADIEMARNSDVAAGLIVAALALVRAFSAATPRQKVAA